MENRLSYILVGLFVFVLLIAGTFSVVWLGNYSDKGNFKFSYSLAHAIVKPGKITNLHRLKTSEVYYILKGSGLMYVDKKISKVKSGCTIYIPPGSTQRIKNTGKPNLEFLCIVDPAWRKEDEEVI